MAGKKVEGALFSVDVPASSSEVVERSDDELLAAVAARDAAALQALYDRHAGLVFSFCDRIAGDRAAAEGLLADVFFDLWDRGDPHDPALAGARPRLVMLARRRALEHVKARARIGAPPAATPVPSPDLPDADTLQRFHDLVARHAAETDALIGDLTSASAPLDPPAVARDRLMQRIASETIRAAGRRATDEAPVEPPVVTRSRWRVLLIVLVAMLVGAVLGAGALYRALEQNGRLMRDVSRPVTR